MLTIRLIMVAFAFTPVERQAAGPISPPEQQEQEVIDGDRPHVGTGAHLVAPGQVQVEMGVQFQRSVRSQTFSSPTLVRIGTTDRIELRAGSDGFLARRDAAATVYGVGNAQIGAKIRLWGKREEPLVSVMPTVNVGFASPEKALGSGESDVTLTLLAGRALTKRLHAEANYGIGSIGDPAARFPQHLVTGAIVHQTTRALASYVEGAWWSRQERLGGPVSFIDYGVIFTLTGRVLMDGGAFTGLTPDTPDYGVFAGLSFAVGPSWTSPSARRTATSALAPGPPSR